jgi:hypothetical protein
MDLLQIAEIKAIRGTTELQTNKLQKHLQKNLTDVILLVCDSSGLALLLSPLDLLLSPLPLLISPLPLLLSPLDLPSKFQLELLHFPYKVAHVVSNNC